MNKLEVSFGVRIPYNSDDEHLNRSANIEFDEFLALNDFEFVVGVK